ncbi:hypothetical protein E4T50_11053 [Aureobasidium sp. EXF-12298]|nr:hypothetical protein E4T50_11053 [Aureobasidium sp. EXF-12298]
MGTPSTQSQTATTPSKGAASSPDKTPSSKQFKGGVVTIVVGAAKKEFIVHKDLLVFYSDYFQAAFNGSFVEATERKIDLFDTDQEIFDHFHTWLYTRKLASENDVPLLWNELVNLWVFGDRFQVPMLQNCVMDKLLDKANLGRTQSILPAIRPAYEKTVGGSLLRKAIIELLVYRLEFTDADFTKRFTFEILEDIVKETIAARKDEIAYGSSRSRDRCFFHVHGKDEHC